MSLMLAALILTVAFVICSLTGFTQRKLSGGRLPKCLPSFPLIGSLLSLRSDLPPHLLFQKLQKTYGNLFSLMMGPHYAVVINNHQHAKEVLLKKGKIFAGRPSMVTTDLLSRGGKDIAFGKYGPAWKFHRKLVLSALHLFGDGSAGIEKMICQEATSMCSTFERLNNAAHDMMPDVTRAVTNVICLLCFNSTYEKEDPEFQTMRKYSQGIVNTVAKDSLIDIFPWLQFFPNENLHTLKQCIATRDSILQKKFEDHKANYSSDSANDLFNILLKAKMNAENNNSSVHEAGLTDDHMVMTVADIFGAGVETSSTAFAWMIIYLIHHPEVQKKIQEEIDSNIGFERTPKMSDKGNMNFLNATIHEILRIQPVSPLLIPHVALADSSIGDYTIPKGTRVIINLWAIHHDEKEWKNPDAFDPGRFLDEDGKYVCSSSESYLPFGAGTRVCLGEMLARMELFLFTSWILQRFTVQVPPGYPPPDKEGKFGIVLQPLKFKVQLKLRKAWENRGLHD
uniref:Steroid 17-alpha-hydroxylase/17,20 lyase n=1 Tax=Squalus acanthias TaxID=7797 RepID=CP17A_SQUAC|nr:RecName: Full=Steroid 17-alpha-hydroxylase/17,20 lyase; AltName: Full=17-alpha-hydroxyprogesterone aldolase; AltName: Full=CYPXVII; AltName: Full=Cytochrome P450 17A1; AltName: Full=Cytochrome P450-C17; Short=Cytochrome P450c17 [Squalus acanthias]AAB34256.1 cytochrome P450c17 [Squalus acanthias]